MNFSDNKPIYLQIAHHIESKIIDGYFLPMERIPSVRDIAAEVEVNPATVMRSFEYLVDKNIIFNKRGIGYFLSKDAVEAIKKYRRMEFLEKDMNDAFAILRSLDITSDELKNMYNSYLEDVNSKTL